MLRFRFHYREPSRLLQRRERQSNCGCDAAGGARCGGLCRAASGGRGGGGPQANELAAGSTWKFDPARSAIYLPHTKGFPKNSEVEVDGHL